MLQVKEECSISLNVTETECLDRFSERKDSGTEFQNGTFVMDSQTEDFYRDPRYPTWCLGDFSRHHINLFMYADNAWHALDSNVKPINCSCKPGSQEEQPKSSTIDEKAYEQQVVLGEQPVTLNEQATLGEDMPDGWHFMEKIKHFFGGERNSEILDEFGVRSFVYCVQYTIN